MQKKLLLIGSAAAAFAFGCATANAQTGPVRHVQNEVFIRGGGAPSIPAEFMAAEFAVGDKAVKGAPYSADAVTESVQVLADGNRITHKSSSAVARDSEGRTRRDLSFPALKNATPDGPPKISVIFDPVANVSYTLDHNQKIARKLEGNGVAVHIERRTAGAPAEGSYTAKRDVVIERAPAMVRMQHSELRGKQENLGSRTIEGVVAEGTRTVQVVPAGEIGNDRPLEIVSERWFSPELQTVVMTRHADPRTGETTYKLANIRRAEPLKSIFEVPADYAVKTEASPVMIRDQAPPKE